MNFRPHQSYCSRCDKAGSNCDLNFKEMKAMDWNNRYSYTVTLVICKEFKERVR